MTICRARTTEFLFQLSWCLLDGYKCFAGTCCFSIQGTRESRNRKMLQGLQKTKQEPTPSAGQKEKITLKSTLKTKNLHHRREKPQIPRDELCLQGRNIYCRSSFTYPYKLLRHRHRTDIVTRARNIAQRPASKMSTVKYHSQLYLRQKTYYTLHDFS